MCVCVCVCVCARVCVCAHVRKRMLMSMHVHDFVGALYVELITTVHILHRNPMSSILVYSGYVLVTYLLTYAHRSLCSG